MELATGDYLGKTLAIPWVIQREVQLGLLWAVQRES
jgi:hypothetical protein